LLRSRGGEGKFDCVAYAPDGQRVVVGADHGLLKLWKIANMEMGLEWSGHTSAMSSLQFSPDSQWILSSSYDCTVKIWDANTGVFISAFTGHTSLITGALFLPSTMYIISTSRDKTVRLWEVNANRMGLSADESFGYSRIAAYTPGERLLISEGHSGTIQHYNANTGEPGREIFLKAFDIRSAAYSPTGIQLATGDSNGNVTLWNTQSGAVDHVFDGHSEPIIMLVYSPCGTWIASVSRIQGMCVSNVYSGVSITFDITEGVVSSLAFSPNGLDIAVGCSSRIIVYDLSTRACKTTIECGCSSSIGYLPGVSQVACCYARTGILRYDDEGKSFQSILNHDDIEFQGFAFSSCGQWISTFFMGLIQLWRRLPNETDQKWSFVAEVNDISTEVTAITWRPDTTEFVTTYKDGSFRVWKVAREESIQLVWSRGVAGLTVRNAIFEGAVGLSADNRRLLEQRGANWKSS
jgi:WD40 repeat protein